MLPDLIEIPLARRKKEVLGSLRSRDLLRYRHVAAQNWKGSPHEKEKIVR